MKKEQEGSTTKRRDFLRLAGASTVGGAAAAAIGATGAEAKIDDERPGGYRETAHVKKVYELSRF
jgi:hypothetical protein